MNNPFEKRATEYLRDDSAFLSIVTPEPLHTFFEKRAISGSLYDRLCMVIGTPGSGKTTIATLLQYHTVHTLLNSPNHTEYTPIYNALSKCKIIENGRISVLGCRIPMESEYRDFWELPYSEDVRSGLLRSFLQARAIILWLDGLATTGGYDLKYIEIAYRDGAGVAQESLGGIKGNGVLEKAKLVEKAIYEISAALVPPEIKDLPELAMEPYHPFDSIAGITLLESNGDLVEFRPLVILDDIHTLHPVQLSYMKDWLSKREMRISRWMLMRLDAQTPEAVLDEGVEHSSLPANKNSVLQKSREITQIWLQSGEDRAVNRRNFRRMARSMADKYLRLMPVFHRQGLTSFQDLLNTKAAEISSSNLGKLKQKIDRLKKNSNISFNIYEKFENDIEQYLAGSSEVRGGSDVKLAMLYILINRYVKRVPQSGLFDDDYSVEPSKPIKVDSGVAEGAKIFLLHEYERPYYYGIDAVCDGSSENAEQFLHLASQLVSASEAKIIRNTSAELLPKYQHQLLRKKSAEIVDNWVFPRHREVRQLCDHIAKQCLEKSLEPNASLGGGANAFGILEDQFSLISNVNKELSQVLKFAVAYGAISIKRRHKTKHRLWTLIELTGPLLILKGLTFSRGGFLERDVSDLTIALEGK